MALRILASNPDPTLLALPWQTPLEEWADRYQVPLPRGLSRHIVRFVRLVDHVYALKETQEPIAMREYRLLRDLRRLAIPVVEPFGVVTGRTSPDGEPLDPVLVTRHLAYSQPYRSLFSRRMREDTAVRLLDALVVLLVRLHLTGAFWGDCSLSNTLFRRDAGALSAYIIDVETGERHPTLSDGQRRHDLTIAIENVAGDLADLEAGGRLVEGIDPIETALAIEATYAQLWSELTDTDEFQADEMFRIEQRLQRLHELGFDAAEFELYTTPDGSKVRLIPRVVEHGFHGQRLKTLTGLETGENQARRLLNDISAYRAMLERKSLRKVPETVAAAKWLDDRFEPTIDGVPPDLVGKLQPAELYHQILEHLWFMSEAAGGDVGLGEAVTSYVRDVLTPLPDEHRQADSLWEDDEWDVADWTAKGWATEEIPVVRDDG